MNALILVFVFFVFFHVVSSREEIVQIECPADMSCRSKDVLISGNERGCKQQNSKGNEVGC